MSLYKDLFSSPSDLLYYSNFRLKNRLNVFRDNPTEEAARNFIDCYFEAGNKEKVFIMDFKDEYLTKGKHLHTVSLYLLGCHLSELIVKTLKQYLVKDVEDEEWFDFRYTWFLTSLYHDAGSVLENDKSQFESLDQSNALDYHLRKHRVENNVFEYPFQRLFHKIDANENEAQDNSFFTFQKELVNDYFFYRLDSENKVDHGIIAGYIMFDRLIKNYEHAWMEASHQSSYNRYEKFKLNDLSWRSEHKTHFAFIASAIIAHNIWFCGQVDEVKYRKYGLEQLFSSNAEKISINKWPLVFFLGLLDTIEPVKRFESLDVKTIYENINIKESEGNVVIEMIGDMIRSNDKEYKKWVDSIYSMPNWLSVSIEPNKKEEVTNFIKITPNR